jgi:hypothetical protein
VGQEFFVSRDGHHGAFAVQVQGQVGVEEFLPIIQELV